MSSPGLFEGETLLILPFSWAPVRFPTNSTKIGIELRLMSVSFDTIKVRLQTSEKAQFKGPLDCLLQTIRHEGARGLYKGATPPLVGWMFMDSMYEQSLSIVDDSPDNNAAEC